MLASSFMYKVYLKETPTIYYQYSYIFFWDYDLDKISVGRQVTSSKHIADFCLLIKCTVLANCSEELFYFPILTLSTEFPFRVSGLSGAAVKPGHNIHNIFGNPKNTKDLK